MDEVQRFAAIKEKTAKASESKIRLEERYKNEREKLEALIKEIQAKGYDPSKLAETKNAKALELKGIMDVLEKDVEELLQKLSAIETATTA
jgi:hypothetical protein